MGWSVSPRRSRFIAPRTPAGTPSNRNAATRSAPGDVAPGTPHAIVSRIVLVADVVRKRQLSMLRVGSAVLAALMVVAGSSSAVAAGTPTGAILKAGLIVPRDVPSAWTNTT